ncbi:MAG: MarR family transcriptional regulator [bacterium]|nr:MarR family transcriptional regulator [bacterium]MCP4966662.1 MarR family transcriptional regulator [bacterium]
MGNEPAWRKSANYLLHFAFSLKAELETALTDEIGIGLADHEALINLKHHDGSLRMTDIADRLILSRGGTTKLVDRLETAGLVARAAAPDDRRVTMVKITAMGRGVVARSRAVLDQIIQERWSSKISDADARAVLAVLERVHKEG